MKSDAPFHEINNVLAVSRIFLTESCNLQKLIVFIWSEDPDNLMSSGEVDNESVSLSDSLTKRENLYGFYHDEYVNRGRDFWRLLLSSL